MSVDGTKLLFEGFLQKRKDTMKIRWATYWFRLHNTTLFFYTKENCSASHLRGYYYIYTVQSVRKVQREDSKRFMFEIMMTNGKRKMLAADTEALRQEWVEQLWTAMHLSTSRFVDYRTWHPNMYERDRISSLVPACTGSDSEAKSLSTRPHSDPSVYRSEEQEDEKQVDKEQDSEDSEESNADYEEVDYVKTDYKEPDYEESDYKEPDYKEPDYEEPDYEEPTYQNLQQLQNSRNQTGESVDEPQTSEDFRTPENSPGGLYDLLPIRKHICVIDDAAQTNEVVYDVPTSFRRSDEHTEPKESIYDVPSSLLRKKSEHSSDEQLGDPTYWRI